MSQFHFFNGNENIVPEVLSFRNESYMIALFGILTVSFFLISISRASNNKAIGTVLSVFFKGESAEQELKEQMRLSSFASVMLILNYFFSFSICIFLMLERVFHLPFNYSIIISILVPIALFFNSTIGLLISGWIAGEAKSVKPALIHTLTGAQFVGLLLSTLSLFWIMNQKLSNEFMILFMSIICLQFLVRLFKNSFAVLTLGVPWYYLILYFCTLEILPLFVAYYYVLKNFRI